MKQYDSEQLCYRSVFGSHYDVRFGQQSLWLLLRIRESAVPQLSEYFHGLGAELDVAEPGCL